MSGHPTLEEQRADNARRRRRFRLLALGAFVFLLIEICLLVLIPHEEKRGRLLTLVIADSALAAVLCGFLVVSLKKE